MRTRYLRLQRAGNAGWSMTVFGISVDTDWPGSARWLRLTLLGWTVLVGLREEPAPANFSSHTYGGIDFGVPAGRRWFYSTYTRPGLLFVVVLNHTPDAGSYLRVIVFGLVIHLGPQRYLTRAQIAEAFKC